MKRMLARSVAALVAALALGALATPAAQAEPKTFHAEIENFALKATENTAQTFTFEAGKVECAKSTLTGTEVAKTTGELTLDAEYSNCNSFFGKSSAKFDMNGCDYRFTLNPKTGTPTLGQFHFLCPVNKKIEITVGLEGSEGSPAICTITIVQQELPNLLYTSGGEGNMRHVGAGLNVREMSYTQDGVFCPGNEGKKEKTFAKGTYKGEVTLKAFNEGGGQIGYWIE
jgi:hypothetical protein